MRKILKGLSICLCLALVNVSSLPNVTINKAEAKVKKPKLSKTSLELKEGIVQRYVSIMLLLKK